MVSVLVASEVFVVGVTKFLEAAVSMNAVVKRSGGLAQPATKGKEFAIMLLATSVLEVSAGSHRQAGVHALLSVLPPFVLARKAVVSCPSLRWVHVVLE